MAARYNITTIYLLIGIILLAFGLRVFDLRERALGGDEVVTLYRELTLIDPEVTANPPDYKPRHYVWTVLVLPFVWMIPNEVGVRWLSVIAGVMVVPVMYRVTAIVGGRKAGMLAALFTAVFPMMVFLSQEARQYTFVMLLNLILLWQVLLIHFRGKQIHWLVVTGTGMLIAALHATAIIWVLIVITWLVIAERGRMRLWIATVLGAGAVAATIFIAEQFIGNELVPPVALPDAASLFEYFRMGFGRSPYMGEPPSNAALRAGFYATLVLAAIFMLRIMINPREIIGRNRGTALVLALLIVPPLVFIVVSYTYESFWLWRYLAPYMLAAIMLAAVAIIEVIPFRILQGVMAGLLAISMLILSALYGHVPEYQHVDWRQSYQYLEMNQGDDAAVIGGSERLWEHFTDTPTSVLILDEDVSSFSMDVNTAAEQLDLASGAVLWIVWSERNRFDLRDWVIEEYGAERVFYQDFDGTFIERYTIP